MKEDQKADRTVRKEERSGSRDKVERDKKVARRAAMLKYSSATVVREETAWGRRVGSSTRKHKYLMGLRLTGEQRAPKALPPKTSPSHRAERGAGPHRPKCCIHYDVLYVGFRPHQMN